MNQLQGRKKQEEPYLPHIWGRIRVACIALGCEGSHASAQLSLPPPQHIEVTEVRLCTIARHLVQVTLTLWILLSTSVKWAQSCSPPCQSRGRLISEKE